VEKIRVRRPPTPGRLPTRRPPVLRGPRRAPAGPPGPIPKAASDAFRRARRRRLVARRAAGVLALCSIVALYSFGALAHGAPSSESGHVRPASPVEAGVLPVPPEPPPPDMGKVWAAAVAEDPSPDLAVGGVGTHGNKVALTFDDGPDPRTTPLILDTLRNRGVDATFFVVGRRVVENPGLLRRIVAEGHAVGNHTYDHADLSELSAGQMRGELLRTQEAVDDALGYHRPMALMRPPYGNPYIDGSDALPAFRGVAREQGLFPVIWTVDPGDYLLGDDPEAIVRAVARADEVERKVEGDEVVLLHDNQTQTAEALPGVIDHYQKSGRGFVGADELLADKYPGP
jgi:peptidoglycan-N-acetylglucosamine deacetylase